jgi:hypothetical protein
MTGPCRFLIPCPFLAGKKHFGRILSFDPEFVKVAGIVRIHEYGWRAFDSLKKYPGHVPFFSTGRNGNRITVQVPVMACKALVYGTNTLIRT